MKKERAARAAAGEQVNYGANYSIQKPRTKSQAAPAGLPPGASRTSSGVRKEKV